MRKLVIVYIVLIVAVILLAVFKAGGSLPSIPFIGKSEAEVNGKKIDLMLAKSVEQRMKGLSGREKLDENQGMLFIFDKKDKFSFWMRGMKFPIDIIYLDDDNVVYIVENAAVPENDTEVPQRYTPDKPSNRVLEINAGKAKELGIKVGTKINFKGI
jgi:uncharacterized membrane protein (UPF0127 family)